MKRRRRAPIASTVTRYRYSPTGDSVATRSNPQRLDAGSVHYQPEMTRRERDKIAAQKLSQPSASWDQDN